MTQSKERRSKSDGEEEKVMGGGAKEAGTEEAGVSKTAVSLEDSGDGAAGESTERPGDEAAADDLQAQHRDLTDRHLRLAAEFDNFRKRTSREWTQRVQGATAELLLDLLEIADNFERALAVEHTEGPYADGVRLIFQQLSGLLRRRGVEAMEALGQPFDPTLHEALLHVASTEYEEGVVSQEIRKGYMLHDRVLRAAQVAVSSGPEVANPEDANDET